MDRATAEPGRSLSPDHLAHHAVQTAANAGEHDPIAPLNTALVLGHRQNHRNGSRPDVAVLTDDQQCLLDVHPESRRELMGMHRAHLMQAVLVYIGFTEAEFFLGLGPRVSG